MGQDFYYVELCVFFQFFCFLRYNIKKCERSTLMEHVYELPLALGIHATYKGYHFLVMALELTLEDDDRLLYVTKNLYPTIAHHYHTTIECIDRNLRTVIRKCWNSQQRGLLQSIASYPLTSCPTVTQFIDILHWHLKKNGF